VPGDPTPRLSRDLILAAAEQIARSEGIGALSMRRLARALDVWPMSVYRYFGDKDALLDALAANAAAKVTIPDTGVGWRERLRALLDEVRGALADPLGGRLHRASDGLRLSEAGLAILADAGLEEETAASAWRALWSYTLGFVTSTPAEPSGASSADDAEFDRGLELLLDGLEARAAAAR
jgi:AcrR family transcriptional regulator